MPWWHIIDGELIGASNIYGPGWTLTEATPPAQAQGGWQKYPNETAARAALGAARRVKGNDRAALDLAIARVTEPNLRAALENLRNNDPGPAAARVAVNGGGLDG